MDEIMTSPKLAYKRQLNKKNADAIIAAGITVKTPCGEKAMHLRGLNPDRSAERLLRE
jgi:hypothetical protein